MPTPQRSASVVGEIMAASVRADSTAVSAPAAVRHNSCPNDCMSAKVENRPVPARRRHTDATAFSGLGIHCYGFTPTVPDPDGRTAGGLHGADERVPIQSLIGGAEVLHQFLTTL